jgi:hypothetical protein
VVEVENCEVVNDKEYRRIESYVMRNDSEKWWKGRIDER